MLDNSQIGWAKGFGGRRLDAGALCVPLDILPRQIDRERFASGERLKFAAKSAGFVWVILAFATDTGKLFVRS